MGKPHPPELRNRIIQGWKEGYSRSELEERFRVGISTIGRYIRAYRDSGTVGPCQFGGYKRHKLSGYEDILRQWVAEEPAMTIDQIQTRLRAVYGIDCGRTAIHNFLSYLRLSYKKRRFMRANRIVTT